MRHCITGTILAAGVFTAAAANADTFHAGSNQELIEAMERAEARPGPDVIQLAPNHVFAFGTAYSQGLILPKVTDTLRIAGHGSTLKWVPDVKNGFFRVTPDGKLTLRSLTLKGARSSAVIVDGQLTLNKTRFVDNRVNGDGGALRIRASGRAQVFDTVFEKNLSGFVNLGAGCSDIRDSQGNGGAVFNGGHLLAARVSFIDNRAEKGFPADFGKAALDKFIPTCPGTGGALHNRGNATIVNATFLGGERQGFLDASVFNHGHARLVNVTASRSDLTNDGAGSFLLGNSAVRDSSCADLTSLGHNVTTGYCQLDGPNDRWLGVFTEELALDEQPNRRLPVLMPPADSPLVDAGSAALCPQRDALARHRPLDGNNDEVAHCDVGAVEREPGTYAVDGRVIGLWYEPDRDGHYLLVEQPDTQHLTVFWATYDGMGNPLWLYGTGEIQGNQVHVPLTAQRGLRFGEFLSGDLSIRDWGALDLDFSTCRTVTMHWNANGEPALDGDATMTRLAFVADKECTP